MFTHAVRTKLAGDYGIRDIPDELLQYFVSRQKAIFGPGTMTRVSTIAFCIANDWQRGLTALACSETSP